MVGHNLQHPHDLGHVRALAGHGPPSGHVGRPSVHLSRYNLIVENLSLLAAQTYDFHPHHSTDGFAQLLVSRTLTSSTGRFPIWTTYSPDGMQCFSVANPHWSSAAFAHGLGFPEAVNMGYFSYYPMIVAVMVFFFLCRNNHYEKASFTVMCSFFIFYLIYIFLPVAGPQFYFQAVSPESVENGIFPSLGTYFNHRTDMLPSPGYADGFFCHLVEWAQDSGERPTAAFPSSHIGITFILLYLVHPAKQTFLLHIIAFRHPFDTGHSSISRHIT